MAAREAKAKMGSPADEQGRENEHTHTHDGAQGAAAAKDGSSTDHSNLDAGKRSLQRLRKASLQVREKKKSAWKAALGAVTDVAAGTQSALQPGSLKKAMGEVRGVNGMNQALWALGVFKHEPPKFEYFDPDLTEHVEVIMKEVRLPRAEQTHEVCFEPLTQCVFVSQMSNSVLVRIPLADGGMLLDDQDAWHVGPVDENGDGLGGLHNVSTSTKHPGCLWISLQFCNEVMLVEAATMKIRHIFKVPTLLVNKDDPLKSKKVGGPHCVRECPKTGEIWVALKGSVSCHPAETPDRVQATQTQGSTSLKRAKERVCCSAKALTERMAKLEELGFDTPPPDGWAVWRLDPAKYNPDADDSAAGGYLYETLPSPPMVTLDDDGNCWAAQDQSANLVMIDPSKSPGKQVTQLDVPHPLPVFSTDMMITGPAIATAPDGAVWCSLLGANGCLVRICPKVRK